MSTIAAGTTTTNALVSTGNTDGTLQFQVNGTTPSVTLNTLGAVGVGSSPSYGTSGQVLTSTGSTSAPTWSTLTVSGTGGATSSGITTLTSASSGAQAITTTDYGQYVKLPDATTMTKAACVFNIKNAGQYPLKIVNSASSTLGFVYPNDSVTVGLADNSTAAGVWDIAGNELLGVSAMKTLTGLTTVSDTQIRFIALDSDRTLVTFGAYNNTSNLYAVVYQNSTATWGTPVLVSSSGSQSQSLLIATDKVLLCMCASATMYVYILTFSGTTITVGTAATAVLANPVPSTINGISRIIAVGSSYVAIYGTSAPNNEIRAMTVSGTTTTIGAATVLSGTSAGYTYLQAMSASVVLATSVTTTTIYATPYTISGTTITLGTGISFSSTTTGYKCLPISSNARLAMYYVSGASSCDVSIISVSGTTASRSSVTATSGSGAASISSIEMIVTGSKCVVYDGANQSANIVTDTSGTASAGTQVTGIPSGGGGYGTAIYADSTYATFTTYTASSPYAYQLVFNISGSSPTLPYGTVAGYFYSGASANNIKWFGTSRYDGSRFPTWTKGSVNCSAGSNVSASNQKTGFVTQLSSYVSYPKFNTPTPMDGSYNMVAGRDNEIWVVYSLTTTQALVYRVEGPT